MRTLIPSIPEARKARVTSPPASSASMRSCSASASPDSLAPQRAQHPAGDDALLAGLGHAGAQVGQDGAVEHLGHLVGDAGDGVDDLVPQRADEAGRGAAHLGDDGGALRARRPGARCWPTWRGPGPRRSASMRSTMAGSRTSSTSMTSAMASRVMSSWVGPSPPHTMTPSLRASAVRRARTMRSWLSPTAWWKWEATPLAARWSPSQAELVSAIWPSSSSVPTATISILTGVTLRGGAAGAAPGGRRAGTRRR